MIFLKTVKRFCKEYWKIENYDQAVADESQTWHCHHRHEIDWVLPKEELIDIGRYYDVHYSELIFLTPEEHGRLHQTGKEGYWKGKEGTFRGKHHTEEAKQKMRDAKKGKPKSAEWKQKISDAKKGKNKGENNPMYGFHRFGENAPNYKYHITAEELYDLYIVQGLSTYKIAELYDCSQTCIQRKLKKFNIKK